MTYDYKKLGFRAGIEIHQQLDTHKLFCPCPSQIREDEPDIKIKRKMRAVAGELGNVDPAALHEFLKNRELIYEAYSDTTCLVELDEEPPHLLNHEALKICLEIAELLNAKPVDEFQIMRKTVIDGSNTSGFQRTILVASGGFIETDKGKVGITTICLEEDAARKISEEGNVTTYRLDRLGIPLVEICTDADIKNPAHVKEVAKKLGMILRATGKVKRGLGTIRQDVNVSITGGERIEAKGVQDLRIISTVAEEEVARQMRLIEVKSELEERKAKENELNENFIDLSGVFKDTESAIIKNSIKKGGVVVGVKLPKFAGLMGSKLCAIPGHSKEKQERRRLGPEFAQYAKGAAGVKGIFHSDELPAYGITQEEVDLVKNKLKINDNNLDGFVVVSEKEETARKALFAVVERAKIAFKGIPKETRRAVPEGTTEFMRPLPGSARMYPETDEPPYSVSGEELEEIKNNLPELHEEREERYVKTGLSRELANQMVHSKKQKLFDELLKTGANPTIIAATLLSLPKEIKKKFDVDVEILDDNYYKEIFDLIAKGEIGKDSIPEILVEAVKNTGEKTVAEIVEEKNLGFMPEAEVGKIVEEILNKNSALIERMGDKSFGPLMGQVMGATKGRTDAEIVKRILMEKLKK
ncbi:glutamyl-tRNA(Gln) amidotransferase subunit E [Candidatus Altiarchaeales archaeon WOR_SM1_SCG]|nr:glutamyl-tRNA(Gln) amidotransferase subunit E [Candidatus Altiarchaeales archaeon WOR_SM1_SCG]